jgi:pimeloyl-ACP methyl ester carboxylesterase
VAASAGMSCDTAAPCACADTLGRSLYNYTYTNAFENQRETEAISAHIEPASVEALLGVPLSSIPELSPSERAKGWKCLGPDDTIPSEAALEKALGALPSGQVYYLDYSPLVPGKETGAPVADWRTLPTEALAFVDNLHDVPAFLTHGERDLVVPTTALPPALVVVIGASRVDTSKQGSIGVVYPDGERFIEVKDYASAGHMITMAEPADFAADFEAWLGAR